MADAVSDLNEMIERIRKEADAAGYARALSDMANWAGDRILEIEGPLSDRPKLSRINVRGKLLRGAQNNGERAPKGENRRRVEQALRVNADTVVSIKHIKDVIDGVYGGDINYSSVQQALSQLQAAGIAEPAGGRGMWQIKVVKNELDDL